MSNKIYERTANNVAYERCINFQQNLKSFNPKVQEPSLMRDALESKKRKLSMYEQALSEEKRKMAKLEREKAEVMLEIDQHKILDGKIKNVKSALEKAKTKNKLAEAELNKLKSTISNDTKQQRETNIKVEQSW